MIRNLFFIALSLVCFSVLGAIPQGYYDDCNGKKQSALKSQLYTIIKDHDRVSYGKNGTWVAFLDTDVRDNNTWWDIYCDDEVAVTTGAGTGMNIEHTFPKSWWGGSKNDAYCDIMHLMPVNSNINSRRGNNPYAEVSSVKWENSRSKTGSPVSGQGGGASSVFEPDDEYKGDLARTYFYMVTCYQNLTWQGDGLKTAKNGSYPTLQDWAIEMLLKWHRNDPVSQKEIDRNEGVYKHQGNRNPFIDHPEMVEYIWGKYQDVEWIEGETPDPGTGEGGGSGNDDDDPVSGDPQMTSPVNNDTFDMGGVILGESVTMEIPVLGKNFSQSAVVSIKGRDAAMFSLMFAGMEWPSLTLTAAQINSVSGHILQVKYTPSSITTENACHTATLEITSKELSSPIIVNIQGECHEVVTLTPIVALDATNVTDDGYTANWLPSMEDIDYYTVYRNVYDETGTEVVITVDYEVDASETSLTFTDRMSDCKETYTVTATLHGQESEHSNVIIVAANVGIIGLESNQINYPVQYYTPSGILIEGEPIEKGVYIRRQNGQSTKVIIR